MKTATIPLMAIWSATLLASKPLARPFLAEDVGRICYFDGRQLDCVNRGDDGRLTFDDEVPEFSAPPTSVAFQNSYACAAAGGKLECWGYSAPTDNGMKEVKQVSGEPGDVFAHVWFENKVGTIGYPSGATVYDDCLGIEGYTILTRRGILVDREPRFPDWAASLKSPSLFHKTGWDRYDADELHWCAYDESKLKCIGGTEQKPLSLNFDAPSDLTSWRGVSDYELHALCLAGRRSLTCYDARSPHHAFRTPIGSGGFIGGELNPFIAVHGDLMKWEINSAFGKPDELIPAFPPPVDRMTSKATAPYALHLFARAADEWDGNYLEPWVSELKASGRDGETSLRDYLADLLTSYLEALSAKSLYQAKLSPFVPKWQGYFAASPTPRPELAGLRRALRLVLATMSYPASRLLTRDEMKEWRSYRSALEKAKSDLSLDLALARVRGISKPLQRLLDSLSQRPIVGSRMTVSRRLVQWITDEQPSAGLAALQKK